MADEESTWDRIKANWRVVLLVVILLASTFALFSPTPASGGSAASTAGNNTTADSGLTNIEYGLELSGGTRIQAPLVGVHASGVEIPNDTSTSAVRSTVAANIENATASDVRVRYAGEYGDTIQQTTIVEVTAGNVTAAELDAALSEAGYPADGAVDRVSDVTQRTAVSILRQKVNQAGLSGGSVRTVGGDVVVVEVPNANQSEVRDLVESRGQVLIQAYHQNENGTYVRTTVMDSDDLRQVGNAQQTQGGQGAEVGVVVAEDSAQEVQQRFVDTGLAQQGGTECRYRETPNQTEPCILLVQDGEVLNSFGVRETLAQPMRDGTWADDPRFSLTTGNLSTAQEVAINLRAGALPAELDLTSNSMLYIDPSQSERFKTDSLLAGVAAVLAVSGVVFARYRRIEVAGPMIVTALSEVVILMGAAAAIGYPVDLSVIAGFIAAIGTGVDDLIIIADEVMSQGEVSSQRVFQSRFRKAFWVIGAAAATTILALSPLAVLSLGQLRGFAIFTILGVLVGVLITRPAYGDILRALLTGEH
ncbi:preprotein translocase subunit SecD [Halolamina salifodinae]|uniref:Protein-export membrane protein SecD n=1 Tax=Halolamina salifodinae TaxID=1202767 RepID=A0A8T4GX19_9EURY|nr:preprotein translocase subunit SecD [Halolamina salifodinae]MBP1985865.1 preprotein translocase subunit SecD [Halolamina salifodinae]